jgi:predicted ATPase/transcriptional regulator with XRE-family HTH domain
MPRKNRHQKRQMERQSGLDTACSTCYHPVKHIRCRGWQGTKEASGRMAVQEVAPFGGAVRRYRRALGFTQEELAERAGLSERAIREIERGTTHVPRKETVQLLADALELAGGEREAFQSAARRVGEPEIIGPGTPSTTRTNLPDEPTPFIGRERELGEVSALLQQPAVRLVTLTGPGGTGKTRLALQVAARLLPQFADGVFFVSLASLSDPELVLSAMAETVGVQERGGTSLIAALTVFLQTKHLLLLLDNLEHLLDAAPLIGELLDACRDLHLLVTSRIPPHLAWEHEYAVPPLSVPDPRHLPALDQLCQYDAVALFLERAQAVRVDFALTAENASAVAEICQRLDGLPLAIVLAAARIKLFPPAALLQRLSSRLTLLTGGARDRPARHQTLRAAIDWSYGLLSEEERALFARLSVFAGGCILEAAETICAPEGDRGLKVLDGVASLVDKSLLGQEGEEEPRFLMLETIREYAAERLAESGAEERLRGQHASYYLGVAEEVAPQLRGPDRLQCLNRLAEEHDNLRAALSWAQEHGEVELGLRLAVALSRFWEIRGYLAEGRRWLTALLPGAGIVSPKLQAAALGGAGSLAASLGNREAAVDLLRRSLILYRQLGDTQDAAEVLDRFAHGLFMSGGQPWWEAVLEECLTVGRELGDKMLAATSLHWLAWLATWQRDTTRARTLGEESLTLYRALGDTKGMIDARLALMHAAYGEGKVETARALAEEVTALLPRLSPDNSTRERIQFVAYRARDWGDYGPATRLLDGVVAQTLETGDRRNAAHARTILGHLARDQGDYDRALALYHESLTVFQELGDRWGTCAALLGLSDVARDQGEAEGVIILCQQALELSREIGSPMFIGFTLHNLAFAARIQAQYPRAEALLDESLAMLRGRRELRPEILSTVGLVALDRGQYDRAEVPFTESLRIARTAVMGWIIGTLLEGLAGVAVGRGQPECAARLFGAADAIRTQIGTPIRPVNRPRYERDVAAVRAALGEEQFKALWDEGRAMTQEQAIAFALDELPSTDDTRQPAKPSPRNADGWLLGPPDSMGL